MKSTWTLLGVVCALVIGVYAYMAQSGALELLTPNAADAYYNLLVRGFCAGQLSVKKEVPPGLARLANPYDPTANAPYQMLDLSYYKGRLYLYFGITPALLLFWPYAALTGHYLFHREAVTIFCVTGFLASAGLLRALWRRYFAELSVWVVAACVLALGLATGVPLLLSQSGIYEVPISCGYMLTMLALGAIWCALHQPERRCRWLVAASVAYGLAVGARPSLLLGAAILLVPVIHAWRERRQPWAVLLAATGPIALIGLGLMLYNALRFDSPFEFGQHYQLAGKEQVAQQNFNLRYLWFNFRIYFLEPARWSSRLPFVHGITVPPVPAGYTQVRNPFGVLTNIPVVWLALAAPLAWRNRPAETGTTLRWFVTTVALLFGMCALTLGLFCGANLRYEVDFIPPLVLLAVVGILGVECVLADRPARRRAARCGWGLLLGFSVAFNLLASVENYAEAQSYMAIALVHADKIPEAIGHWEQALRIEPDYAEAHNNLGTALFRSGRVKEGVEHLEKALRIKPEYAEAHYNLGVALAQLGRMQEAIEHYQQALRIKPDFAEAHSYLGTALFQTGKVPEAMGHWEQALRTNPDLAEAQSNLGVALVQLGKPQEAIGHYQQALRIKPDYAEAHYNLAVALVQLGRRAEAIDQYEQVLRIKPDFTEARNALAHLQARQ